MNTETNFMSFENLAKLIEEHKKETHHYKRYEFDSTSYTLLLISINNLIKENQALKKQLEEYKATNKILSHELTKDKVLQQDCLTTCCGIPIGDIPKLITQQKEFIEYLENEIYSFELRGTSPEYNFENVLKRILLKYKEIIGDDK